MGHPNDDEGLQQLQATVIKLNIELDEYKALVIAKNKEIALLKLALADSNEIASESDSHIVDMETLEEFSKGLAQRENGLENNSGFKTQRASIQFIKEQMTAMQRRSNTLSIQCDALEQQLQQLRATNLAMQQQSGRVAELESLLAITEKERETLQSIITQTN